MVLICVEDAHLPQRSLLMESQQLCTAVPDVMTTSTAPSHKYINKESSIRVFCRVDQFITNKLCSQNLIE